MDPRERDVAYLWDMREAAKLVVEFIEGLSYAKFIKDKKTQSAVERELEIIGEAARHVSAEFQLAHPEIPWRNMIGLRNILAHEYGEVRLDHIWLIATTSVAELIGLLDPLIPPIEDEGV